MVASMNAAADQHELEVQFFTIDPFFAEFKDEPRLLEIAENVRERALAERRKLERVGAPT